MTSEDEDRDGANVVYKMKVVQFMDRAVPIILQNDNGPCPLLAISNVLLLRNNVTLSTDMAEVSQRELMDLVANWLLEANISAQNKDDVFWKNQQKNIDDAICLLPRLATGIDVNVKFTDIFDFEYTPECAIFDLFHVRLVHGWLCDPQDEVTSNVIGSNSYNTLVEKLVAWKASKVDPVPPKGEVKEDPATNFEVATDAAPEFPTSQMSALSDETAAEVAIRRKGDEEEAAELLQALQLSQSNAVMDPICQSGEEIDRDQIASTSRVSGTPHAEVDSVGRDDKDGLETGVSKEESVTPGTEADDDQTGDGVLVKPSDGKPDSDKGSTDASWEDAGGVQTGHSSGQGDAVIGKEEDRSSEDNVAVQQGIKAETDFEAPDVREETSHEQRHSPADAREEILQEQDDSAATADGSDGSIIDKFLNDSASQLTYHGLFSLLDKLNNNELYVFFRNNHFSTLFKYEGQIFLLATDQGYLAQPDLVWEKLDEVKGDTLFATGAFQQFQVEQNSGPWSERDAVAATADFMSSQHTSGPSSEGASYSSDFQLAMALQQDELVQQQQQQQQQKQQQLMKQQARSQPSASHSSAATKAPTIGAGRLVTGPTRSTVTPPKPDPRSKDSKCSVM